MNAATTPPTPSLAMPSIAEVRAALAPLTLKQIDRLAELSGTPAATIYKIKNGNTANPGIETLRGFVRHIDAARAVRLCPECGAEIGASAAAVAAG